LRNKLNYTEAVTVLIVILIGIIIGFSVYNNDEVTVLKTLNDVTIEDKVIEDGNKAEITVDSKAINNENVEAESVNVKAKENSNEVIEEVTDLPFPQFDLFSIDLSGLATIAGKGLAGLILRSRHRDGREAVSEEIVLITPILETDEQDKNIIVAEESSVVNLDKSKVDENNNEDEQEDATKINTVNKKETIESNELDTSNVSVAIVSSKDLKVISPALQKNAPRVSDVIIDAISYDTEGEVLLSGRGVEDQHIRIYVDNKPIKTRSIEADGTWSMDLQEIDAGVYILRIDQLDSDGVVTSRTETPFQKETSEIAKQMAALANSEVTDSAPRIGIGLSTVVIQPGYTLWAVARKTYGFGMQYVRIYHANKDQIRDPDLIYPGQIFKLPE